MGGQFIKYTGERIIHSNDGPNQKYFSIVMSSIIQISETILQNTNHQSGTVKYTCKLD